MKRTLSGPFLYANLCGLFIFICFHLSRNKISLWFGRIFPQLFFFLQIFEYHHQHCEHYARAHGCQPPYFIPNEHGHRNRRRRRCKYAKNNPQNLIHNSPVIYACAAPHLRGPELPQPWDNYIIIACNCQPSKKLYKIYLNCQNLT